MEECGFAVRTQDLHPDERTLREKPGLKVSAGTPLAVLFHCSRYPIIPEAPERPCGSGITPQKCQEISWLAPLHVLAQGTGSAHVVLREAAQAGIAERTLDHGKGGSWDRAFTPGLRWRALGLEGDTAGRRRQTLNQGSSPLRKTCK
jgi:hypothetical protein